MIDGYSVYTQYHRLHKESDPNLAVLLQSYHAHFMPACLNALASTALSDQMSCVLAVATSWGGHQAHDEPSSLGTSLDSAAASELSKLDLQIQLCKPGVNFGLKRDQANSFKNLE